MNNLTPAAMDKGVLNKWGRKHDIFSITREDNHDKSRNNQQTFRKHCNKRAGRDRLINYVCI